MILWLKNYSNCFRSLLFKLNILEVFYMSFLFFFFHANTDNEGLEGIQFSLYNI